MKKLFSLVVLFNFFNTGHSQDAKTGQLYSLAQKYQAYFPIGAAVSPRVIKSADSILIINQYNSLVAENHMKPMWIQPKENAFTFENDYFIGEFAKRHDMKLRGHTLVWHNQTPDWFFEEDDQPVSKEVLKERHVIAQGGYVEDGNPVKIRSKFQILPSIFQGRQLAAGIGRHSVL